MPPQAGIGLIICSMAIAREFSFTKRGWPFFDFGIQSFLVKKLTFSHVAFWYCSLRPMPVSNAITYSGHVLGIIVCDHSAQARLFRRAVFQPFDIGLAGSC
jgi:hypothetical protein